MKRAMTAVVLGIAIIACPGAAVARAQAPGAQAEKPAQAPAPSTARPAARSAGSERQVSPSQKALDEANALKDRLERIAALRKVAADYPKTREADTANTMLLDALVRETRDLATRIVSEASDERRASLQRDVATRLLSADGLLEDAETYAKAAAAGTGSRPLTSRDKSDTQSRLSTLAQVYAKRGKNAEAEKTLREVYDVDPASGAGVAAAVKLAEYAKAAGRDADQLDYLSNVALGGRLTPESLADLHTLYRKTHNGSLEGLEAMLDARYEKQGPKPPEAAKYVPTPGRSDRLVLAELFTGAGCPPCVPADLAFESAIQRYGSANLAVLMYHLHAPRPDPMVNPYTVARRSFYKVTGVPTFAVDGIPVPGGGGNADAARALYDRLQSSIEKELVNKAAVGLKLDGSRDGKLIRAKVVVTGVPASSTRSRLHLALVEEQVRYSGENGIRFHPMVVRSLAGDPSEKPKPAEPAKSDEPPEAGDTRPASKSTVPVPVLGYALVPGQARTIEFAFDLDKVAADGLANLEDLEQNSTRFLNHKFAVKKHEVDPSRLRLVAFVQDEETKQVLQAASADLR